LRTNRVPSGGFFNWTASVGRSVLEATRPHIEMYRDWLEERGLAASTIDRRLSAVCGFNRFAHIDGRVASNPAQYVRRPQVHPSDGRGPDRSELGRFLFDAERCDHDHAALAVLLGTTRALRAATEIVAAAKGTGLEVRAGVRTGEVEVRPDDVVGLTVSIAKRICDLAGPGEVFLSEAVKFQLVGSEIALSERGLTP